MLFKIFKGIDKIYNNINY